MRNMTGTIIDSKNNLPANQDFTLYLKDFFARFNYPDDAADELFSAYSRIAEQCPEYLKEILEIYYADYNCDYGKILKIAEDISAKINVHEYTVKLLVFICLSKRLKELYSEKNYSENLWYDAMCDLKYKLDECKDVYHINGTFVADWFAGFFNLSRFALGRFQFQIGKFDRYYKKGDKELFPDSNVVYVHIPRSKVRLEKDICDQSYKMAREFFAPQFVNAPFAFVCGSWLLYPENKKLLPQGSNLLRFMNEYDIIESKDYGDDHPNLWRLFDMNYNGDPDSLPEDSSLRRAYKNHIKNGGKTGSGFGVFFP